MESLFRNSLGPTAWIILGLIPPAIFALYFLKLKRQPLEVPSTYLWHRVIEDLHVNSLWQRLRKSLLMFLQLLVVGLAILAVLRPGWQGESLQGEQFIFLVDNSASMSATDGENGRSRLDEAKARVSALVDQMESDMSAMIISFAEQPNVVQEFTNNRRQLHEALARIEPSAAQTDLTGALRLADGFANPGRVTIEDENAEYEVTEQRNIQLYILSDGRFAGVEDFSLGNLQPLFLPIGSLSAENVAITAFNTRQNEERPELRQAFVQLANFSTEDHSVVVELYLNDQLLDAAEVQVPAEAVASTTFNLLREAEGELRATIDPGNDFKDELGIDNTAYAVLENQRDSRVLLVTPGNNSLEAALTTDRAKRLAKVEKITPAELEGNAYQRESQTEYYDLIIFDQCVPKSMPQANTLFIGTMPPSDDWTKANDSESVVGPQIIDWQRSHALLSLLELGGIQIADANIVRPPLGGRVLVDSTDGPLVAIAPRDHYEDVAIGFEIIGKNAAGESTFNTDWPRKHSFPGFWLNVLDHFAGGSDDSQLANRPEKMVELKLSPTEENVEVILPDGSRQNVAVDDTGRLGFQDTEQLGVYDVLVGGRRAKQFAVNLFDRPESDVALRVRQEGEDSLNTVESLEIGYVDVAAQPAQTEIRREMWKPLLLLALFVLLLEWYIYNRRVYI
ncbi:vWA domain-containing protein [Bythopirellula goksoeyrii]|uniref:VWFA domain-containing protein n=1 Tax=Bythopirellula goksoeyrii TaxID=1400387 RepID=A0A5B9Q6Z3_9BACT|nr:BatA and WFA domain-containing protein [Bythopirellula goksoeyrii]QEG34788.1 hypothetical protein Pr1d_20720 [Bythopirellula goksoeyrii]